MLSFFSHGQMMSKTCISYAIESTISILPGIQCYTNFLPTRIKILSQTYRDIWTAV